MHASQGRHILSDGGLHLRVSTKITPSNKPLLRRHLIKYKAYWTRLVSVVMGEQLLAIIN